MPRSHGADVGLGCAWRDATYLDQPHREHDKQAAATTAGAPEEFEIGDGEFVEATRTDTQGMIGASVSMPNACWPSGEQDDWDPDDKTTCSVVAYATELQQYVVADEDGIHYLFKRVDLQRFMTQAQRKGVQSRATSNKKPPQPVQTRRSAARGAAKKRKRK